MTITTMPGNTVPMRNPLLVMPDMAEVPRRVTSVAHQYMAIENSPTKKSVLGEVGHADHVGDRRRGEAEYGGIPDDVLYPLQEDGREAHVFVEGLFDPCVDAAAFRGEGAASSAPTSAAGIRNRKVAKKM